MKRTKVGNIENNIIYVEPNYTFTAKEEYDVHGLNTYEYAPPLEDYCIYVNLEVEKRGRNVQTSKSSNNQTIIMSFTSKSDGTSSVNFLQGTKIPIGENGATINSLTTNYTDIFLKDLKQNGPTTETFGIESIDISYNHFMVPEVTIQFVDVRGVALFAQREMQETSNTDEAINSNNKDDIADSFFQCFFTFPYPKFSLLVKGFYGQPVSYELTCADFRARFDSRTGNFACTAKFVGYYFSFLNDVMMNGVVAAPYSDYIGAKYWEKREFKLKGVSGGEVNLPKIGYLLKKMKNIEADAEKMAQSDPTAQEKAQLDQKTDRFQKVENQYNAFVREINKLVVEKYKEENLYYTVNTDNGVLRGAVILSPSNECEEFQVQFGDKSGQIKGAYESFEKELEEYNNEFPNEKLPKPDKFYDSKPMQRIFDHENEGKKATMYVKGNEDIKEDYLPLFNKFKQGVDNGNTKEVNPLLEYKNAYYYNDKKFSETLEEYKNKTAEETKEVEKKIEELKDTLISKALGFHPSVENITRIIMAHFETFVRMIFETAKTICNEDPKRTIKSLGVSDARDISDAPNKEKTGDLEVPPFPKVVTEVKRENSTIREESWVGDYSGDFREKDLVHGIINGIKEISKDIQAYESSGDTSTNGGSESPNSAVMKFPLAPIDMSADSKPYASGGYDPNDVSSLLGLVGLRGISIFGGNNIGEWDSNAKTIGTAEAYNFLADHKLSKEMIKKLSDLSGADAVTMMKGDSSGPIKRPGDGTKPWPWRLKVNEKKDGIIAENGDLDICRIPDGGFAIPYQNLSWEKIKNECINSQNGVKAAWSPDYINSKGYPNLVKNNIFTFDTNVNQFSSIAESQVKGLEGIDYYQEKFLKESKYNKDEYKKYLKNGDKVIAYIIENASKITPSDGSCMLPTSKKAFSNKSFEHGYNMNYFHGSNPGDGGSGQIDVKQWLDKDGNVVKRKGSDGYDKYLDSMDSREFTFTEFPGLTPTLDIFMHQELTSYKPATSVFGQYLYYKQETNKSKALLFLASLGYVFDYKKIISDYVVNDERTMFVMPLPALMFIGALLWSNTTEGRLELKFYNTNHYKDSLDSLLTLRCDIKERFIKIFEKWVSEGVEGDSLLRSFNEIKSGLELNFTSGADKFFTCLGEQEEKNILGIKNAGWVKKFNQSYETLMDFYRGELSDDFLRNYIAVDEDVYGDTTSYTRGIRLGNRDGGPSSLYASNFALAGCSFSKNSKYFKNNTNTNVNVNTGTLQSYFDGFLEKVKEEKVEDTNTDTQISQAKVPDDSNTDIKIGIYRYCKLLYDKWVAGLTDKDFDSLYTMEAFFEGKDNEDKYFHFIDSFYNIADFIPLGIGYFCDQIVSCYRNDQYSLLAFLSSVYSHNRLSFMCVNNFMDLGKKENMERMFDTISYTETWNVKRHPNFIVMYPYESSNYLADMKNNEYENDGFMINQKESTDNKWPEPLKSRNANSKNDYSIPAFGVSYGRLYQSYFMDVDVSMDNPTVTEQSIKAQFAIACQNNEGEQTGDRSKLYTYGQDLYSIYSNNSYTCNVTMMGCAWVQPAMYFVLNNIPMFRGTYFIIRVNHTITPGNMVTKFTGVRMSNVCTRIARDEAIRAKNNQSGNGESNGKAPEAVSQAGGVDNDCPYKEYPLTTDGGHMELSSDVASNANQIMKAIMARGYSKAQAAGIVGNMQVESPGLNPKTVICDSQGYLSGGLCMWHKNSLEALIKRDPKNACQPVYKGYPCKSTNKQEIVSQMPDAAYQVKFLLDSLEEDSYLKSRKIKQSLLAETTPEGAAFLFAKKYEVCGGCSDSNSKTVKSRSKNAKTFYDNFKEPNAPKIANNADKHMSDLANGFVHALNQTAAASSNGVEIGVDSSKSKGDTLWLTNAKNSSNFSTVMDMILSAYSSKVSSVNWILPGNGQSQNSVPVAYLVTVKEGNSAVNVKVTSENNPNTPVSKVHVSKGNDNSGIHEHFCKALAKKYKSPSNELKKDTNNQLDDYPAIFNEDKYKLQKCNEGNNSSGGDSSAGDGNTVPGAGSNSTWAESVKSMGIWYKNNIHTYQTQTSGKATGKRKMYPCTVGNWSGSVGDDCSGYVSACLQYFGAFKKGQAPGSCGYVSDAGVAKALQNAGFRKLTYSWDSVQPFDIIAYCGHVEILAEKGDSPSSWGWGNIHDGINGHAGMPAKTGKKPKGSTYKVMWRYVG